MRRSAAIGRRIMNRANNNLSYKHKNSLPQKAAGCSI
jgi:hypothetical protein